MLAHQNTLFYNKYTPTNLIMGTVHKHVQSCSYMTTGKQRFCFMSLLLLMLCMLLLHTLWMQCTDALLCTALQC